MKPQGVINLILPAVEINEEYQPSEYLLKAVGTTTKELIEMFLNTWAEFKNNDHSPLFEYSRALQSSLSTNARLLTEDIIFGAMERRVETGELAKLSDKDQDDVQLIMMSIWQSLSESVFELIEELGLNEQQISQLRFVRWIGDDFVISFPRFRTAVPHDPQKRIEDERKLEQERVE